MKKDKNWFLRITKQDKKALNEWGLNNPKVKQQYGLEVVGVKDGVVEFNFCLIKK